MKSYYEDEERQLAQEGKHTFFRKLQNECPNGIWWWERLKREITGYEVDLVFV